MLSSKNYSGAAPLAIDGGVPVRDTLLPYNKPHVSEDECAAVVEVMRSGWLTTGPDIREFEQAFEAFTGARHAVAVSSGTAALHAAYAAIGIGPGDEVIVPAITFASTATAVMMCGGVPVIADVEPDTVQISCESVRQLISPATRAIAAVDYAGQPCHYEGLRAICDDCKIILLADACHALGADYHGQHVGTLADISAFSLHAVKPIAAGEGGMVTTDNPEWAARVRTFRNHGIATDHHARQRHGMHAYDVEHLGFNYRMTGMQGALALKQLERLPEMHEQRRNIAAIYDAAFADCTELALPRRHDGATHARHLYPILLRLGRLRVGRDTVFAALRAENIGVNVHYPPLHHHTLFRNAAHDGLKAADETYARLLSLPLFSSMNAEDAHDVIQAVEKVLRAYRR